MKPYVLRVPLMRVDWFASAFWKLCVFSSGFFEGGIDKYIRIS